MNPQDPTSFNHQTERLSTGRTYHFIDQIPDNNGPVILCVHGFPDLWYGWRYQIGPWTKNGYRVVVPDMLGYGGTDKPVDAQEYSTKKICDDLAALLDFLNVKKAIIIGHDWGSYIAGRFALWHPDRLLALAMFSVPFVPPAPQYFPIEEVARRASNLGYQVYLANPISTREIEENFGIFLQIFYSAPSSGLNITEPKKLRDFILNGVTSEDEIKHILNGKELQYYRAEFKKGGLNGPLSYYRTTKFRFEEEKDGHLPNSLRHNLPVLHIYGTTDPSHTLVQAQRAYKWILKLQNIALEGRGHWIMVEAKEEITQKVLDWLDSLSLGAVNKSKM